MRLLRHISDRAEFSPIRRRVTMQSGNAEHAQLVQRNKLLKLLLPQQLGAILPTRTFLRAMALSHVQENQDGRSRSKGEFALEVQKVFTAAADHYINATGPFRTMHQRIDAACGYDLRRALRFGRASELNDVKDNDPLDEAAAQRVSTHHVTTLYVIKLISNTSVYITHSCSPCICDVFLYAVPQKR